MLQVKNKPSKPSLLTATIIATSLLVTACGDNEHEEIHAVDKVEEASALARENAPEPEDFNLEVTQAPAAEASTEEADATDDADSTDVADTEMDEEMSDETVDAEDAEVDEADAADDTVDAETNDTSVEAEEAMPDEEDLAAAETEVAEADAESESEDAVEDDTAE